MAIRAPGHATNQPQAGSGASRRSIDGERLIAVFKELVAPLGQSLPSSSEVVLHDLSLLPDSIVAIYGTVTGRRVGDPTTNLLLEKVSSVSEDHVVGYESTLSDGRKIRSSTMVIRDVSGLAVAALCINSDLSVWTAAQRIVIAMLGDEAPSGLDSVASAPASLIERPVMHERPEVFARNVDELAAHLIYGAIEKIDVPVDLMHKRHKIEVVRDLKARGMFLLRDAVDMIAASLEVTRFTIYNYLNEIGDETGEDATEDQNSASAPVRDGVE